MRNSADEPQQSNPRSFTGRQNRASFSDLQSKGYYTEYQLGFPNSTYTTTNLSAMGK
jgi:hypothetical protein